MRRPKGGLEGVQRPKGGLKGTDRPSASFLTLLSASGTLVGSGDTWERGQRRPRRARGRRDIRTAEGEYRGPHTREKTGLRSAGRCCRAARGRSDCRSGRAERRGRRG